jgi:hypothetical protein
MKWRLYSERQNGVVPSHRPALRHFNLLLSTLCSLVVCADTSNNGNANMAARQHHRAAAPPRSKPSVVANEVMVEESDVQCAKVRMSKEELDKRCGNSHQMEDGCHKGDPHGTAVHVAHNFIHIPKTAGTTVELALGRSMSCHQTAVERLAERSADETLIPSFGIVRNPFDRLVSMFKYQLEGAVVFRELGKDGEHQKHRAGMASVYGGMDGFLLFLQKLNQENELHVPDGRTKLYGGGPGLGWWRPQLCYLTNHEYSDCIVDHIIQYETLNSSYKRLRSQIPDLPDFGPAHARGSHHEPFCTYYNETTAQLAREIYAMDFSLFRHTYSPLLPELKDGICTTGHDAAAAEERKQTRARASLGNSLTRK